MNEHFISVVISFYNNYSLTQRCLTELAKFTPNNCEVILVNDASTETDFAGNIAWWQRYALKDKLRYVVNEKNLGFGGSYNRGASFAKGDIIVLLSNDVLIHGPFIPQIEKIIDDHEGNVIIGGEVLSYDTGWNTIILNSKPSIITYPVGWLLATTKGMWKRIGGFDPIYYPYDAEDLDLGAWALYNDVPMVGLNNPHLRHLSGQTVRKVNPEREKITIDHIQKFREKWTKKLEEKLNEEHAEI